QTLGFMLAGVLLGVLGILTNEIVQALSFMVSLALGLIGYNIGHELHSTQLQGRIMKLLGIVVVEATAAFALVSILTYMIVGQLHIAILFGALASATAPAATADVVWECECEGPLTSSLMFVLAGDDIVAVILTNFALAYAVWFYNPIATSFVVMLINPIIQIIGSAVVGGGFAYLFLKAVDREKDRGKLLELELGMVVLIVGLVEFLGFSDIFAAMVFGFVVGRYIPKDTDAVPHLLQRIMAPVIMIFFVMVGARMAHLLTLEIVITTVIIVAIVYLGGRTIAKYFGTRIGATLVGESESVKKYLGTCLFCQAGVALGLSFIVEEQFVAIGGAAAEMGILILGVVALSTMVLEGFGPVSVKYSLNRAGEMPEDQDLFNPSEIRTIDITQPKSSEFSSLDEDDSEVWRDK
ncbi:MAG: cation:proton antiporter, partial [Candidatus Thorarchaeota archaeon]|nr:cation:proton antiporter [Candidatus Thorarchaeota archaeon]